MHTAGTRSLLQGAPRSLLSRLTSPNHSGQESLEENANLETQSAHWLHWCLEVRTIFLPFSLLSKTMASLCPQRLPCEPPPHNGPIQSPTKSEAPSLTACVRRAPNTKGGVSRFSEHFTIVHQRRNKSKPPRPPPPPFTSGSAEAGLCHAHQNATFFWLG